MKKVLLMFTFCTILLSAQEETYLRVRMVRHGQPGVAGTDFTQADKAAWSVLGLTPLGRKQAETTGNFLKKEGVRWHRVIASPQERAAETADIICSILGMNYTLSPDLREVGNAIRETLPALRKRFSRIDPGEKLPLSPQGRKGFKESNAQCGARGKKFITDLMNQGEKGPVLLVAHGHFIRCTVEAMTGGVPLPWNCGMVELKVLPDGKAELVKAAYPEVLPPELLTCNANFFHKDPWMPKFMPHPAVRPDGVALVNSEFRDFVSGRRSSWKRKRGTSAGQVKAGEGKLILTGGKKSGVLLAPRFPSVPEAEYTCSLEIHGSGRAVCRILGSSTVQELALTPQTKSYELKFSTGKTTKFITICFEALPGSKLVLTKFLMTSGKAGERQKTPNNKERKA